MRKNRRGAAGIRLLPMVVVLFRDVSNVMSTVKLSPVKVDPAAQDAASSTPKNKTPLALTLRYRLVMADRERCGERRDQLVLQ